MKDLKFIIDKEQGRVDKVIVELTQIYQEVMSNGYLTMV